MKDKIIHKMIINGYERCRDTINNLTTSSNKQMDDLKQIYKGKRIIFTNFPTLVNDNVKKGNKKVPEIIDVNKYILFFGSVNKYKGVDILVKAFLSIKNKYDTKLVIAGRGTINNYKSNNDIIWINRFIDDVELRYLFEKSLFVVYPYLSATMSGVLSIAYYFRKRMLLSDIPFFLDYASDDVVYFKSGDTNDLSLKIKAILNNQIETPKGDNYKKFYGESSLIESYKKLYL